MLRTSFKMCGSGRRAGSTRFAGTRRSLHGSPRSRSTALRERSRRQQNGAVPLTDEIPSWRSDEHRLDLEHAIQALPPGYREVVVLHDIEGYTHDEIAGLLGIETGTSKSQLFRARRALRERLCRVRL